MRGQVIAGAAAVLLLSITTAAQTAFDVASVKPNNTGNTAWSTSYTADSWHAANATLSLMIQSAYGISEERLVGGPGWMRTARFDVNAKAGMALPREELRFMAQRLLETRFGVSLSKEQREQEVYELRPARRDGHMGPDLRRADDDCLATSGTSPADQPDRPKAKSSTGALSTYAGWCVRMARLATGLSRFLRAEVVDETGLTGRWDFVLAFNELVPNASGAVEPAKSNLPTIFVAVEEQLGLKLERNPRGSVEYAIVVSARMPTEN